jgi:hypothetical protein
MDSENHSCQSSMMLGRMTLALQEFGFLKYSAHGHPQFFVTPEVWGSMMASPMQLTSSPLGFQDPDGGELGKNM